MQAQLKEKTKKKGRAGQAEGNSRTDNQENADSNSMAAEPQEETEALLPASKGMSQ